MAGRTTAVTLKKEINEGEIKLVQSLSDKNWNYHGSDRFFYSGVSVNSGTAWSFVNFSGTSTGFGVHGREECNRMILASSGTSIVQWSFNSGTDIHGELWAGDNISMDGVQKSGLWVRASSASQGLQIWAW